MIRKYSLLSLASLFVIVLTISWKYTTQAESDAVSSTQWQNAIKLTNINNSDPNGVLRPSIAAAPGNNTVIVAYMHKTGSNSQEADPYYVRSTNNGNVWSAPQPIHTSATDSRFVNVALDNNNQPHAVWTENDRELWYAKESQWAGNAATKIFTATLILQAPILLPHDTNTLELVWSQNDGPTDFDIYHARSTNGGSNWSDAIKVSNTINSALFPSIAATADGKLHVVWEEQQSTGNNYEIMYAQSSNGGSSWSTPLNISQAVNIGTITHLFRQPSIIAEGNTLYVTYENRPADQEQRVYYVSCTANCTSAGNWSGGNVTVQNFSIKSTDPAFLQPQPVLVNGCFMVIFSGINGNPSENNERIQTGNSCDNWSSNPTISGVDAVMGSNIRAIKPSAVSQHSWWVYLAFERVDSTRSDIYFVRNVPALYLPVVLRSP